MKKKFRILMGLLMIIAIAVTTFSCKKSSTTPEIPVTPITVTTCGNIINYDITVITNNGFQMVFMCYGDTAYPQNFNYKTRILISPQSQTWDTLQYSFSQKQFEQFEVTIGGYPSLTYPNPRIIIKKDNTLLLDSTFQVGMIAVHKNSNTCNYNLIYN